MNNAQREERYEEYISKRADIWDKHDPYKSPKDCSKFFEEQDALSKQYPEESKRFERSRKLIRDT